MLAKKLGEMRFNMKLAMITSGFLPVPATKGGAVENLIENFLRMNEECEDYEITVFSIYDEKAKEEINKFKNTKCIFIKSNFFVDSLDKSLFFIAKNILKKKNSHSYRFICRRLHYLNQVSKYLKKNNYDKVLLENHPSQYLALKWRDNYKKYLGKYYYHCHNEFAGTYSCEKIIDKTKRFICVSQYISESLQNYLKLNVRQSFVLRNGIDEGKFNIKLTSRQEAELRNKYNIGKDDKILLFTGRIVREKGAKELINALNHVQYKNYKLLIVGAALNDLNAKTPYELEIEELVTGMGDRVVFTGFIKYDKIPLLYHIADIAVLPSIWDDPAPLTIIEALLCGLPIITTVSGGIPEYATHGSAILIERDSNLVENLANEIQALLVDDVRRKEMSKKSLEVSKDLTLKVYYQNFIKLLQGDNDGR